MKKYCVLIALCLDFLKLYAQEPHSKNPVKEDDFQVVQSRLEQVGNMTGAGANSILMGFDNRESTPKGDVYLFDEWVPGDVIPYKGNGVKGLFLNVDLFSQLLELKTEIGIKVANEIQIKEFTVYLAGEKHKYISLKDLKQKNGDSYQGFGLLLFDKKVQLIKRPYVYVKHTKYVPGFEVGSPTPEIKDKVQYFINIDGTLLEIARKTNYGKHHEEIKKYMKENKLRHKREEDILQITRFLNSLL